jgi:hypothetical protein
MASVPKSDLKVLNQEIDEDIQDGDGNHGLRAGHRVRMSDPDLPSSFLAVSGAISFS